MQLLLVNLMAATSLAVTATGELDWATHYGDAKAKAAKTNRRLLVVIENPEDASARLDDAKLIQNKDRVQLIQGYELCRVDATTPYGKRVAEAFGAKTLPYTAITDRSVRYITYRKSGKMSADQWSRALSERQALGKPQQQTSTFDNTIWSTGTYCST